MENANQNNIILKQNISVIYFASDHLGFVFKCFLQSPVWPWRTWKQRKKTKCKFWLWSSFQTQLWSTETKLWSSKTQLWSSIETKLWSTEAELWSTETQLWSSFET